jgi:hypothetical protein
MASCTAATVTAAANADTWINQSNSSENKGDDSILKLHAKSGNNNVRALVRFNMPSLPPGCVVQSATLRLYAASWANNRTLQALQVNAAWAENAVTWGNQPVTTGVAATTSSGSGYRQWNVTAQVQAMYNTSANHGFLIRDANENSGDKEQQFHSREKGDNMPQLVISFGPAPTATPIPTNTPLPPTATTAPTATPTATATQAATATPTNTPVPPTAEPTATATPTNTPEPTATETPTQEPTATETPTPEPTATETPTPEPTATETPTPEPPATETPTPEPPATETPTPEPTATETPTETPVP